MRSLAGARALAVVPVLALLLGVLALAGPAQAAGRKQCLPRPAQQSLVVSGALTCHQAKKILPQARELALVTVEHGYAKFTIRGLLCKIRHHDPKRFVCHDLNGKPKRTLIWADKT